MKWRQTGSCNPNGAREPSNDKGCNTEIDSGMSGYCECSFGNVMYKGCTISPHKTCKEACKLGG